MSQTKQIIENVKALAEPVVERESYELVDVEYLSERGRMILRLTIDAEGGVNVDDCSHVSRIVGDLLDVEEVVPGAYSLEVSSPGLFRPLTKPAHFDRAVGARVKVRTFEKLEDRRVFTGVLKGHADGQLTVDVDGREYHLSLENVAKANLEPALEF